MAWAKVGVRGKGPQIVARACGERDDWLPKTEQVDIRPRPPGVRNAPDKARISINLSREKKNATAKIAPPASDAKKETNVDTQIIAAIPWLNIRGKDLKIKPSCVNLLVRKSVRESDNYFD